MLILSIQNNEDEQNTKTESNFKLPTIIGNTISALSKPELSWKIIMGIIFLSIVLLIIYLVKSKHIYFTEKI
jgi:hypothetical protein